MSRSWRRPSREPQAARRALTWDAAAAAHEAVYREVAA